MSLSKTLGQTHSVSSKLFSKLQKQMRLILITQKKPKQIIKLDPLDPQDINIDLDLVKKWSQQNQQLYQMILDYGMAAYICNKEFLYSFYQTLVFVNSGISHIDQSTLNLINLIQLNLTDNFIQILQNIPTNIKKLYLDFNQIIQIRLKKQTALEFLSISHNQIDNKVFLKLIQFCPDLRCLNISFNKISDLRIFVQELKKCKKLKILISLGNPISLLRIYWKYITENLDLQFFENQKYVKPEIPIPEVKKQEPKVEQKKEDKKQAKKDLKKANKVQEKIDEPQEIIKIQPPEILTQSNFTTVAYSIQISNLEELSSSFGVIVDDLLLPENTENFKKQTSFWIVAKFMGRQYNNYQNRVGFDTAAIDGEEYRLFIGYKFQTQFTINSLQKDSIDEGMVVEIHKQEPKLQIDVESGQVKPILKQGKIQLCHQIVGSVFVDFRKFYYLQKKNMEGKYRYFDVNLVNKQGFFKNPLLDEEQLIKKNEKQFQQKAKAALQQKKRKLEQEEAARALKKGGKDSKKPVDKKPVKKEGKQQVQQKRKIEKSNYPIYPKIYSYIGEGKMYKGSKELLCISIKTL